MIRCNFTDRFEIERNKLVRIVKAVWNGKRKGSGSMDVFKEYVDGKCNVRNLAVSHYGLGYLVYNHEEPEEWDEPWMDCRALKTYHTTTISERDKKAVVDIYPGFRWMLDKIGKDGNEPNVSEVYDYLKAWLLWPECERLLNAGFRKLCISKAFAKMPYLQQQKIAEWLKRNPGTDYGLGKIQTMMSKGITSDEYDLLKEKVPMVLIKYFGSQVKKGLFNTIKETSLIYTDYIDMAKSLNHDTENEYWKFPNDLVKAHEKVIDENARKEAAMQKKKMARYLRAVKSFLHKKIESEGLTVYVPENYETIDRHARALHQCLTYADYIGKVSDRKCLLIFIKCGDTPKATAEIMPDGKVGQFYGDEKDRDNCMPGEEEKKALDNWMKMFKPRLRKQGKEAA